MMSLKKDFASGVVYTAIAKYSGLIIQIIITAILSRLLPPEDFGTIAIVTVFVNFFNTLTEAGIGPLIIQEDRLSKNDVNSLFTVTLLFGLVLSLLFFACSGLVGRYYNDTQVATICKFLCLLILASSADVVPNSLLLKQKRFKTISIRTLSVQVVVGVVSIYTAFIGWGIYSLVISAVLPKILVLCINFYINPLQLNFRFKTILQYKGYAGYQFLFNIVNYFSRNLDKMIVGRHLGMLQLGYYEKSYRLMMLPLSNVTYVINPVLHPIFTKIKDNRALLVNKYLELIKIIACISVPLTVILFFGAEDLIMIFFGSQWSESVFPFKILSLTAATQVIHATASSIFQSVGYTKGLFLCGLISALLMVTGFYIAILIDPNINSIAFSFFITCELGFFVVYWILFKYLKESILKLFKVLYKPFLMGIVEFVILSMYNSFFIIDNTIVSLSSTIIISLLLTIILIKILNIVSIKSIIMSFRKS